MEKTPNSLDRQPRPFIIWALLPPAINCFSSILTNCTAYLSKVYSFISLLFLTICLFMECTVLFFSIRQTLILLRGKSQIIIHERSLPCPP